MTFEEWYGIGWDSDTAVNARDAWNAAVATEREDCARLCERLYGVNDFLRYGERFAKAIRDRSA